MEGKGLWIVIAIVAVLGIGYMLMSNKSSTQSTMNSGNDQAMAQNPAGATEETQAEGVMVGGAMMTSDKDIVDNAINSKDHTTLVAAVQAAGLAGTLKGEGPFTVFAPTNAAFGKLPEGTVDMLVMPESKEKLTGILTYHVVPGRYRSTDITEGLTLTTVQGQDLTFTQKDGKWWINGQAMIEIADVMSSNGVTHVIDTVLMPQ